MSRLPAEHGAAVSLTLDDSPSPAANPHVLAPLAAARVPAVFCSIGQNAPRFPALIRLELAAGHELCDDSRDRDLHVIRHSPSYGRQ